MYFKEKENTNIDGEFKQKKNFDFKKYKPLIFIIIGIIALFIILFIVFMLTRKPNANTNDYSLELIGASKITITLGNDYIESGYTATDSNDNDVTSEVKVNSNLKINEIGTYEITYSIGEQEVTRIVNIVEPNNGTYIYLKGEKNVYLKLGENYKEPGYVAHDTIDGEITNVVTVTGKVNSKQKGLYKILYSVTNSNGITTQVERNVIVGQNK